MSQIVCNFRVEIYFNEYDPKISGGQNHTEVRWSIGLWNIFHKKLMITSIAEFSHSNPTTASRPS
jgi:hypothetical protein